VRKGHIVRGLFLVIALASIAAIVFRVGGPGKVNEAKDVDVVRAGLHPCLANLRRNGWRHSDQLEALCAP
jgi:hypothetical protein